MDIKKLLLGGIVGGVAFFLLGWLIYGMLLMSFMTDNPGVAGNISRPEAEMLWLYLIIGNLASGFLMAYIFVKANIKSVASGFVTGGIIGLLMSLGWDCITYATTNVLSKKAMAADVIAAAVMAAIVGALVGLVLGMGKKAD